MRLGFGFFRDGDALGRVIPSTGSQIWWLYSPAGESRYIGLARHAWRVMGPEEAERLLQSRDEGIGVLHETVTPEVLAVTAGIAGWTRRDLAGYNLVAQSGEGWIDGNNIAIVSPGTSLDGYMLFTRPGCAPAILRATVDAGLYSPVDRIAVRTR